MLQPKQREVPAGKFKAKCLGLLDEVQTSGQEIVVTKYGKPVAKITAVEPKDVEAFKSLKGTVKIKGDIVEPTSPKGWDDDLF
jgi:prevent-host-death family protein